MTQNNISVTSNALQAAAEVTSRVVRTRAHFLRVITPFQKEVFTRILQGKEDKVIADELSSSYSRVRAAVTYMRAITGSKNRIQLYRFSSPEERQCPPVTLRSPLNPMQRKVLLAIVDGQTEEDIAKNLSMSANFIRNQTLTLMHITGLPNRKMMALVFYGCDDEALCKVAVRLTPKQQLALDLVVAGKSLTEMQAIMGCMSPSGHIKALYKKFRAKNRAQLMLHAMQHHQPTSEDLVLLKQIPVTLKSVFDLMVLGHSNDKIALRLGIPRGTACTRSSAVLRMLDSSGRTDLIKRFGGLTKRGDGYLTDNNTLAQRQHRSFPRRPLNLNAHTDNRKTQKRYSS